jgi:hypothetical protein
MLIVRLTCQPEMVTCDSRVFIKRCYLKIIKSGSYQQDLINRDLLSTWSPVFGVGQQTNVRLRHNQCHGVVNIL